MTVHEAAASLRVDTHIRGFDAAAHGGLPRGRITALLGSAGAGKTIFALQTLAHRMREHDEHAIFVTFEQPVEHVIADVGGFDWDFAAIAETHLTLLDAGIGPEAARNGEFTLDGLLATLTAVAALTDAKTIVLDGIDALISGLGSEEAEREELGRVVSWLRKSGLTGILTVKSGDSRPRSRAREEYLEYHTDCVIELNTLQISHVVSRTLRIIKYRGSGFNSDLLPLVLGREGIQIISGDEFPIEQAPIMTDRLTTGVHELDLLLEGGYLRGSTTLVSGSPGTAKSTLSTAFLVASAREGHRGIYFSFDETERQIASHMASVGFGVREYVEAGVLRISPLQAKASPPEQHVANMLLQIAEFGAEVVVIDPVSAILKSDHPFAARIIEHLLLELRRRNVTLLCTSLLDGMNGETAESTQSQVSTLADTWMHLSYVPRGGERNRALTIVKSRGTAHSNQVRELSVSSDGVTLKPVYTSEGEVLLGNARLQKEATDRRAALKEHLEQEMREHDAERELGQLGVQLDQLTLDLRRKQLELELLKAAREDMVEAQQFDLRERVAARNMDDSAIDEAPVPSAATDEAGEPA